VLCLNGPVGRQYCRSVSRSHLPTCRHRARSPQTRYWSGGQINLGKLRGWRSSWRFEECCAKSLGGHRSADRSRSRFQTPAMDATRRYLGFKRHRQQIVTARLNTSPRVLHPPSISDDQLRRNCIMNFTRRLLPAAAIASADFKITTLIDSPMRLPGAWWHLQSSLLNLSGHRGDIPGRVRVELCYCLRQLPVAGPRSFS
jgi:hypothetical protein